MKQYTSTQEVVEDYDTHRWALDFLIFTQSLLCYVYLFLDQDEHCYKPEILVSCECERKTLVILLSLGHLCTAWCKSCTQVLMGLSSTSQHFQGETSNFLTV